MLREPREPRTTERAGVLRKDKKTGRFQIVKLEERIAPAFHTNPQGKKVGGGNPNGWV